MNIKSLESVICHASKIDSERENKLSIKEVLEVGEELNISNEAILTSLASSSLKQKYVITRKLLSIVLVIVSIALVLCINYYYSSVTDKQTPTKAPSTPRHWISLKNHTISSATGGSEFKKWIRYSMDKASFKGKSFKNVLGAHAPGSMRFDFERKITEFSCLYGLRDGKGFRSSGTKGNVTFKIITDSGPVFKSLPLRHRSGAHELKITFPPSSSITLETDSNGSDHEDWSCWIDPMVR